MSAATWDVPGELDVVVPVRNGEPYLAEALTSLQRQTWTRWRAIVVENGSTDRTLETLKRFSAEDARIRYIEAGPVGLVGARNLGIARCTAEYIALLDADDVWLPGKLQRQMDVLRANPNIGVLGSWAYYAGPAGKAVGQFRLGPVSEAEWKQAVRDRNPVQVIVSSAVMRRELVERVGGFDPQTTVGEDLVLFTAIAQLAAIYAIPESLLTYRVHGASMSAETIAQQLQVARWQKRVLCCQGSGKSSPTLAEFSAEEASAGLLRRSMHRLQAGEIHYYRLAGLAFSEGCMSRGFLALARAFVRAPVRVGWRLVRNFLTLLRLKLLRPRLAAAQDSNS